MKLISLDVWKKKTKKKKGHVWLLPPSMENEHFSIPRGKIGAKPRWIATEKNEKGHSRVRKSLVHGKIDGAKRALRV